MNMRIGRAGVWALTCAALMATGCTRGGGVTVRSRPWGQVDGKPVYLYTLSNSHGMTAQISNYGGTIVALHAPDREGKPADVTLGFDSLQRYTEPHPKFGSLMGRFTNRIGGAKFTLDGRTYELTANAGENHIHGGPAGFDRQVWSGQIIFTGLSQAVRLVHTSPDGHEGYPGNVTVSVIYQLTDNNELLLEMSAESDAPTVMNLTNHAYWNLAGHDGGDVRGHVLRIYADKYTAADERNVPTGEVADVAGTPLDFRQPTEVGARIEQVGPENRRGYDHNYVVNGPPGTLRPAAEVYEPKSGRVMEVLTTQPGVQLYTANGMRQTAGKDGATYGTWGGLCLETQHHPNTPNIPGFPQCVVRPGRPYRELIVYRFSTR